MKILVLLIVVLISGCGSDSDHVKIKTVCLSGVEYYQSKAYGIGKFTYAPKLNRDGKVSLCEEK